MTDTDGIALSGSAVIARFAWFANAKMGAPMVKSYRSTVKVYGNHRDCFMLPDTARSMASALLVFADKAERFEEHDD